MMEIVFFKTARFLSIRLPLRLLYGLAAVLADFYYLFSKKDKEFVMDNLKTIFPDISEKELAIIRKEVFRNFAKYLVDFFRFDLLDKNIINKIVKIENVDYLDEALKINKGVIALTAHIGNWEMGGAVLGVLGYDFSALALPHKDKRVDNFFNVQRQKKGVDVIAVGLSPTRFLTKLKENRIVAILGDRDFGSSGMNLDFFGKDTFFPKGPAFFSIVSGAPIILGFMIRQKDNRFKLVFEKPIIPQTSDTKEENIAIVMRQYLDLIARYVKMYPGQWFMFRRFWERQAI